MLAYSKYIKKKYFDGLKSAKQVRMEEEKENIRAIMAWRNRKMRFYFGVMKNFKSILQLQKAEEKQLEDLGE